MTGFAGKWSRRLPWLLALMLFALAFQGERGLWEPDEGRYTDVALEMLRAGNFLVPMLNPERPHFTKPPLTYWSIAASVRAFGTTEWAVRLPNSIAFVLTVLLVYRLGGVFVPRRPWLPAVVYATMPLPFAAASVMTTDSLLTLWETAAITAFAVAAFDPRGADRRLPVLLMWLAFGLAFLTKGPPGLLPLVAVLGVQFIDRPIPFRILFCPLGIAVFLVAGFGWYVAVAVNNPELVSYFIGYEVVERVASGAHHRNSQWYGGLQIYLPTLLVGGLPWVLFALRRMRPGAWTSPRARWKAAHPHARLLVLWIAFPLLVFMLARSRLPLYVLPLAAPLALVAARAVPEDFFAPRRKGWWLAGFMVVSLLALRWYSGLHETSDDDRRFAAELRGMVPGEVEEVLFVDVSPRYGLGFYFDAEIEQLCLLKACTGDARFKWFQEESLDSELDTPEARRLFIVDRDSYAAFEAHVAQHDLPVRRLADVRKYVVVVSEETAGQAVGGGKEIAPLQQH